MPGREAEEDAEARGELTLSYTEFIQARLLREAPPGAEEQEREDTEEEDFYDEPLELESTSTSAHQSQSQPQPKLPSQSNLQQSQSFPSSSQNFLFSSNSSSSSSLSPPPLGLSPTPGNEVVPIIPVVQVEDLGNEVVPMTPVVQVEDSQVKPESVDASGAVQPIDGSASDGGSGGVIVNGTNGNGVNGNGGVNGNAQGQQSIRDIITAVHKGPLSAKKRAKTKRVLRREFRAR